MKKLTSLVLGLCDLLEAEGRVLKWNVKTIGVGCGLCAVGLIFGGIALGFMVAAICNALGDILPTWVILLIGAIICGILAGIILWGAKKWMQKSDPLRKTVQKEP